MAVFFNYFTLYLLCILKWYKLITTNSVQKTVRWRSIMGDIAGESAALLLPLRRRD